MLSLALRKQSVRISLGHSLSLLMVLLAHKYHLFTFKLATTTSLQLCSNSALIILTPFYHLNPHKLAAKILRISKISTSKIIAKFNHTMSSGYLYLLRGHRERRTVALFRTVNTSWVESTVLCWCTGWKGELSFTLWQLLLVRKSSRYLLHGAKVWITKLKFTKDECQCVLQYSKSDSRVFPYITLRFSIL
jgi:hypothetical protein